MKKIAYLVAFVAIIISFASCGGDKTKNLPKEADILMAHDWKLQPNETLDAATDSLKDATDVTADIELQGDVEKIANFLAETLEFGTDKNDKSKLAYQSTIGEGLFSVSNSGYWDISDDGKELKLAAWDSEVGGTPDTVTYIIVELNDEKLVIQEKDGGAVKVYAAK